MPLLKQKVIYRDDLVKNPERIYVFGDNIARVGFGGQAKAMRGELNAIGICTKVTPNVYMSDKIEELIHVHNDLCKVAKALHEGKTVVWPKDGIGTGLAKMKTKSPLIFGIIQNFEKVMSNARK